MITTGMFDKNGIEIHTGDLIRFWCYGNYDTMTAYYGPSKRDAWTKCIDHVEQCRDDKFYAIDDETAGGAHLEDVAKHCMIVGRYMKPAKLRPWWKIGHAR